jgi:hypothetical protein
MYIFFTHTHARIFQDYFNIEESERKPKDVKDKCQPKATTKLIDISIVNEQENLSASPFHYISFPKLVFKLWKMMHSNL